MSETPSTETHQQATAARDAVQAMLDQIKPVLSTVTDLYDDHSDDADADAAYYAVAIAREKLQDARAHLQKVVDRTTPSPWSGVTGL